MKAPIKLSLGSEQRESEASKKERLTNGEKLCFVILCFNFYCQYRSSTNYAIFLTIIKRDIPLLYNKKPCFMTITCKIKKINLFCVVHIPRTSCP